MYTAFLESGTGHSYGLELMSRWKSPRVLGQLSYTLSKTDRVFSSLNFGHPFPFKFDRRHMLYLTGEFMLIQGKKATHSLSGGLSFMSGHWETVKSGTYPIYSLGSEEKRETRHEVSVGVYNLTNRHNAYSLSWDSEDAHWKKLSIFPILPNFSYRLTL